MLLMVSPQRTPLHAQESQKCACEQWYDANSGKRAGITQVGLTAIHGAGITRFTRLAEHVLRFVAGVLWAAPFSVHHDFLFSNRKLGCELAAGGVVEGAGHSVAVLHAVVHWGGAVALVALQVGICEWFQEVEGKVMLSYSKLDISRLFLLTFVAWNGYRSGPVVARLTKLHTG